MQTIEFSRHAFQNTSSTSISWLITVFTLIALHQQIQNMFQYLLMELYCLLLTIKF
jgi:hypothetical protein